MQVHSGVTKKGLCCTQALGKRGACYRSHAHTNMQTPAACLHFAQPAPSFPTWIAPDASGSWTPRDSKSFSGCFLEMSYYYWAAGVEGALSSQLAGALRQNNSRGERISVLGRARQGYVLSTSVPYSEAVT